MENIIQIFSNPEFGEIRTATTEQGEPLFCLADVCKALELDSSQVIKRLDDGVASIRPIQDSLGRTQRANFVNEDGLYDVILGSRKPTARKFRKWVTSEVLPSIRKTGGYMVAREEDTPEEIMARALLIAQKTIERKNKAYSRLESKCACLESENATLKKGNDYLNVILQSKGTATTTQIAQDYGMSAVAFNRRLRDMHIQRKVNGQWILYEPYMGKGYVHSKTIQFFHSDGTPDVKMNTEWTQRGRLFLYDVLKEAALLPLIERNQVMQ